MKLFPFLTWDMFVRILNKKEMVFKTFEYGQFAVFIGKATVKPLIWSS